MNENNPILWEQSMEAYGWVPVVVELVERVHDRSRIAEGWSTHDSFELSALRKGKLVFSFTGGREATMNPGDIMIIRPNMSHRVSLPEGDSCDIVVLRFTFAGPAGQPIDEPTLRDFLTFLEGPGQTEYLPISAGLWSDVSRQINRILAERRQAREGGEFMSRLLVLELFVLLSRALRAQWEADVQSRGRASEYMRSARRFIDENYDQDLTLRQIASFVYLSPSYFVRAFKEAWGESPMHYLQQVRLQKAQELLTGTELSIRDVAIRSGFSDQRRMNELFTKSLGISPMKYRKGSAR